MQNTTINIWVTVFFYLTATTKESSGTEHTYVPFAIIIQKSHVSSGILLAQLLWLVYNENHSYWLGNVENLPGNKTFFILSFRWWWRNKYSFSLAVLNINVLVDTLNPCYLYLCASHQMRTSDWSYCGQKSCCHNRMTSNDRDQYEKFFKCCKLHKD